MGNISGPECVSRAMHELLWKQLVNFQMIVAYSAKNVLELIH